MIHINFKDIIYILLFLPFLSFSQDRKPFNNLKISEDSVYENATKIKMISDLRGSITELDEYILANTEQLELLAITTDSKKPVEVINGEWPENTEVSVNLLRDQDGNVLFYAEYPFSHSGDWSIGYEYYADALNGNIYGFRRTANFFNSVCVDGVLQEESVYYFDKDFMLIGKDYSLTNTDGKTILGTGCYFPYDYEYTIPIKVYELVK